VRTVRRSCVGSVTPQSGPGATSIGAVTDPTLDKTLATVENWGAAHAAAALVGPEGVLAVHGDTDHVYWWASITKLLTGLAVLTAVDDGTIELDEAAPSPAPDGATVRHLLAHASGLAFDGEMVHGRPGTRRIYSNTGFDTLGTLLAARDAVPYETALRRRVLDPLEMSATVLVERPSQGLHGPLEDLVRFAGELLRPTLLSPGMFATATHVSLPGLDGVLPGVGRFDPLDWGLGFELHDGKDPHWMGTRNSVSAFGHFGGSGTFLWVDPVLDRALVCLTDRVYGPWALDVWPPFSDAVIDAVAPGHDDGAAAS
jgi:CubicO group peptidase (beta-lactamase class C family)